MFLETKRLYLRKFEEVDFEDFCEYAMDDEMSKMMGRPIFRTKEDARSIFLWLKDKEDRSYALVYKETGRVIGNVTITEVPDELDEIQELQGKSGKSLSFCISKAYQRQGLMYEVLDGLIAHLFQVEELDYVHAGYFSFNLPSNRLQKKLGFKTLTHLCFDFGGQTITSDENILWNQKSW